MTTPSISQAYFAARDEFNAANDLLELLHIAEAVPEIDHVELDPGAALRAAMRLAAELKEAAQERFSKAQEDFVKA